MTLRTSLRAASLENMRHMRMHEALQAKSGMNLFCSGSGFTKQIFGGVFGDFCLILPHMPHVLGSVRQMMVKNMRLMREHEDRVFKGFYLFRIGMGVRPAQNMRIDPKNMRHILMFCLMFFTRRPE